MFCQASFGQGVSHLEIAARLNEKTAITNARENCLFMKYGTRF